MDFPRRNLRKSSQIPAKPTSIIVEVLELRSDFYDEEEIEMRKLKIYAFSGEYQIFEAPYIRIKMYCPVCKKWVVPDKLSLGKAHIYGTHCGISQDLGCVWFKEEGSR
jgi:hypothetical protein